MSFETRLKQVAWTEIEVGVAVAGAVLANQWLPDEKIFKKQAYEHPDWFHGGREDAPWYIYWSGGLKAAAALGISTYVTNPWAKLVLFGIAIQGTIQQARVLTWNPDKQDFTLDKIGSKESNLDAELVRRAEEYRKMMGPEYTNKTNQYINGDDVPLSERYSSSVGAVDEYGNRYRTSVGRRAFDLYPDDVVEAF